MTCLRFTPPGFKPCRRDPEHDGPCAHEEIDLGVIHFDALKSTCDELRKDRDKLRVALVAATAYRADEAKRQCEIALGKRPADVKAAVAEAKRALDRITSTDPRAF